MKKSIRGFVFLLTLASVPSYAAGPIESAAVPKGVAGEVHAYFNAANPLDAANVKVLGDVVHFLSASPAADPAALAAVRQIEAEASRLTKDGVLPGDSAAASADVVKLRELQGSLSRHLSEDLKRRVSRTLEAHRALAARSTHAADATAAALGSSREDEGSVSGRTGSRLASLRKAEGPAAKATEPAVPTPSPEPGAAPSGKDWRQWTKVLTGFASFPFLFFQVPQLWKNIGFMRLGTPEALEHIRALSFVGYGTSILADLLILSWFLSQKNIGPSRIQAVGVVTAAAVLATIWLSGFMSAAAFWIIVPSAIFGLGFAFANYKGYVPERLWNAWSSFINVAGLIVVPLSVAALFGVALKPVLIAIGAVAGVAALLRLTGRLPEWLKSLWKDVGAWTATLLFMVYPVAQLWQIHQGLPATGFALGSIFFGTLGNLMMLGEASESKNRIWSVGSGWAVVVGGLGVGFSLFVHGVLGPLTYGVSSLVIVGALAFIVRQNMKFHGESLAKSLSYLVVSDKK